MGLNLKIVLCDINGDHSVGPIRGNESFEKDPVFLPYEWELGLGSCRGEWRCVFIPPACNSVALEHC